MLFTQQSWQAYSFWIIFFGAPKEAIISRFRFHCLQPGSILSNTLASALHLLHLSSCKCISGGANLSHGICFLALPVFMCLWSPWGQGRATAQASSRPSSSPAWSLAYASVQNMFCFPWSSLVVAGPRPGTAGPLISSALECTCSNQHLNHSFIQQIYFGHLLCARDCSRGRAYSSD